MQTYTLRAVAEALRLSEKTVRTYIKDGRIHPMMSGSRYLFTDKALREFLAGEGLPPDYLDGRLTPKNRDDASAPGAMNVLTLFRRFSPRTKIVPQRGGEYTLSCPICDGRMHIWPLDASAMGGRFKCEDCGISGDGIECLNFFSKTSCVRDPYETLDNKLNTLRGHIDNLHRRVLALEHTMNNPKLPF